MLAWPAAKTARSSALAFHGCHLTVNFVLASGSSSKVKVDSISSGQSSEKGWRVRPPCSSEKLLMKTSRSGAAIVFRGVNRPGVRDIVGVITKRSIADTVIDSYDD